MKAFDEVLPHFLPSLAGGFAAGALLLLLVRAYEEPIRILLNPYRAFIDASSDRLIYVLMGLYFLVFGTMSILRHDSLRSNAYDLGIFDQVLWNSAHGRLFDQTVMIEYTSTLLGNHFSPILLLLVPFYWLFSDARFLLVAQTAALAIGALPVYWLARDKLGNRPASLALASCYFLFPALHFVNLFDFHEIAIASPLLGFTIYYLIKQRYRPFAICLFFALMAREEVALVTVGLGLWIILMRRKRLFGLTVIVVGAIYGYVTIMLLIPHFQGANEYYYVVRYANLGKNFGEIASTVFFNPLYVASMLTSPQRIEYVLQLLVPLGLLPAIGLDILALSFPSFAYLLLSNYKEMYDVTNQYSAVLIPPIFLAMVHGIAILIRKKRSHTNRYLWAAVGYVLVSSLVSYYLFSPGPFAQRFRPDKYAMDEHAQQGIDIIQNMIPPNASVSAQTDLVPHLSHRIEIYMFPYLHNADYVLLDKHARTWPLKKPQFDLALEDLASNPAYELIFDRIGYLLYQKKPGPLPYTYSGLKLGDYLEAVGYELSQLSTHVGGSIEIAVYWKVPYETDVDRRLPRLFTVLELIDENGNVVSGNGKEPGNGSLQTDRWTSGDLVRERYTIPVPIHIEAGDYSISASIRTDKRNTQNPSMNYTGDLTKIKVR
ncbi:MAG: DUF2079 domain-containing protein [Dehalococcoidia bacterium]|nr:DUF2079 domain-containing protein [Dehalococcoidia bacterium]